jgi:single-strand DNA-binding protein
MDTNVIVISGKLASPVDYKQIPSNNRSVAHFTLFSEYITKDKVQNKERKLVSTVSCETWDKIAENCNMYLNKGSKVSIIGYLKQDVWTNKEGISLNKLKVVAHQVIFTDRD